MDPNHSSYRTRLLKPSANHGDMGTHQSNNGQFELKETEKEHLQSGKEISSENNEERKIDFVLVYIDGDGKQGTRDIYENNLKHRRLKLEDVPSFKERDLHFVKVHAPLDTLYQKAEDMNIQMPIKKDLQYPPMSSKESSRKTFFERIYDKYKKWDPFVLDKPTVEPTPSRTKTTFSKTNVTAFETKNEHHFFENAERSRMVHRILQLTSFNEDEREHIVLEDEEQDNSGEDGHGIEQLCLKGVYKAYFPMHDGPLSCDLPNDRWKLRNDWASFSRVFKYQPLDAIRSYCGVRVSFYFAWLGAYNTFLIPAAIVGVLCFLYAAVTLENFVPLQEICDKSNEKLFYMCPQCDRHCSYYSLTTNCVYSYFARLFDNGTTVFFSIFMSVWATLFLEYWKRTEASLAFEWDVYGLLKEYEPLRPKFVVKVKQPTKENPVTNKAEPYIPRIIRIRRGGGALGVVCFMILIVIGTLVGIIVYRAAVLAALYAQSRNELRENAKLMTSFTAASINLLFIQFLTFIYVKIAVFLTNWENPRTVSEFHNSFTFKMYAFEFVNTYSALFYVAFFQSSHINGNPVKHNRINGRRIEECHPSGCLIDVCIQLAVIMVGKQILGFIVEFGLPSIRKKWVNYRRRSSFSENLPHWESDYLLSPEPDFRMFYEYLDMVIQFGFVTMFVASFPLAPLFALLNNMIELRSDAINFIVTYRRRVAEQVRNIGIWFKILELLTKISVVVNSFVIAFTTDFIPRLVYMYGYSPDGSLRGYVNNSLTYININDLEQKSLPDDPYKNLNYSLPHCRFKEYVEPRMPYDVNKQFLYVMLFRMVFVIVFQYFVFFIKDTIAWLVPDVPSSVQVKISRKMHVARMCFRKSAVDALRETTTRQRQRQQSYSRSIDAKLSSNKGNIPEITKNNRTAENTMKTDISSRTVSYV